MKLIYVLLIFSRAAFSQPPATYLGSHRIGETVQEWMSNNQINLSTICLSRKSADKTVCKLLSAFQGGKLGTFYTTNDIQQKYEWLFVDGKVAHVSMEYIDDDMQRQIAFLAEKYGEPTKTETVAYKNALGASWDCINASWDMPDGASIRAVESIKNVYGPKRWITVTFYSAPEKERVRQIYSPKGNRNPYDN